MKTKNKSYSGKRNELIQPAENRTKVPNSENIFNIYLKSKR